MPSLTLLADQDAQLINGGWGDLVKGYTNGNGYGKHPGSSTTTITHKSAATNLFQVNDSNNFALGLGLHGSGTAVATSSQENSAIISTVIV